MPLLNTELQKLLRVAYNDFSDGKNSYLEADAFLGECTVAPIRRTLSKIVPLNFSSYVWRAMPSRTFCNAVLVWAEGSSGESRYSLEVGAVKVASMGVLVIFFELVRSLNPLKVKFFLFYSISTVCA